MNTDTTTATYDPQLDSRGRMLLFHGTTSKAVSGLKTRGVLRPRGTRGASIYAGTDLESHPDRVYLTDTYALQFAQLAVEKRGGKIAIVRARPRRDQIEADTDCPDLDPLDSLRLWGTCSIRGEVEIDRIYVLDDKPGDFGDSIHTQVRHRALGGPIREDMLARLAYASTVWQHDPDFGWERR